MNIMYSTKSPIKQSSILDAFFHDDFSPLLKTGAKSDFPKVNILNNKNSYDLEVFYPGVKNKKDFDISVKERFLNISYDHKQEFENKDLDYLEKGMTFKSFYESYKLGDDMNVDDLSAKYEDGVLRINIPKKENRPDNKIKIDVQ